MTDDPNWEAGDAALVRDLPTAAELAEPFAVRLFLVFETFADPDPRVEIECTVCGDLIVWLPNRSIWACRSCHRPLVAPQIAALLRGARHRLKTAADRVQDLDTEVRGGWIGRCWRMLLRRSRGR